MYVCFFTRYIMAIRSLQRLATYLIRRETVDNNHGYTSVWGLSWTVHSWQNDSSSFLTKIVWESERNLRKLDELEGRADVEVSERLVGEWNWCESMMGKRTKGQKEKGRSGGYALFGSHVAGPELNSKETRRNQQRKKRGYGKAQGTERQKRRDSRETGKRKPKRETRGHKMQRPDFCSGAWL